jgi:hypothetical protein
MTKKYTKYAKLFTQKKINNALEEYKARQRELIEVTVKKKNKKK